MMAILAVIVVGLPGPHRRPAAVPEQRRRPDPAERLRADPRDRHGDGDRRRSTSTCRSGPVVAFIGGALRPDDGATGTCRGWSPSSSRSLLGGLVGCWQGFWIAYVGIPAFIVTLGGMLLFRGLAIVLVGTTVARTAERIQRDQRQLAAERARLPRPARRADLADRDRRDRRPGRAARSGPAAALVRHDLRIEPFAAFITKIVVFRRADHLHHVPARQERRRYPDRPDDRRCPGDPLLVHHGEHGLRPAHLRDGRQPLAAMLSGVKTKRVNFMIFVNMGLLAGVAAVVTTSRAGAGRRRRPGRTSSSTRSPLPSSAAPRSPAGSARSPGP